MSLAPRRGFCFWALTQVRDGAEVDHGADRPAVKGPPSDPAA
jgi:hypothetical protein